MAKTRRAEAVWIEARERWQINVQRDGKRKTFTSTIPGRKGKHDAEAKADDWLDAGQPDDMRFDAAWGIFLEHVKKTTGTSYYNNTESIGRIWLLDTDQERKLSRMKLSKMRLRNLQAIIDTASDMGRSKKMCMHIRSAFVSFFKYAHDQRWEYDLDPSRLVIPAGTKTGKKHALQPDKLRVLFSEDMIVRNQQKICSPYIFAWRFLVVAGLRSGELCGLKKADYDGHCIHIRRAVNRYREITPGKTDNAQRTIVLPQIAKDILAQQAKMLEDKHIRSVWLFPAEDGTMADPIIIRNHWRTYRAQHGIDISIHELRHTFISVTNTVLPASTLKQFVGHSATMDTDGIYGHAIDGEQEQAAMLIDQTFRKHLGM